MEGETREAVLERLRALHRIQQQLTGVITQLSQLYVMYPDRPDSGEASTSYTRPPQQ
jgi:hypothetical protein